MRWISNRVALILVMAAALLLGLWWMNQGRSNGGGNTSTASLVCDLRTEIPWCYRWVNVARYNPEYHFPARLVNHVRRVENGVYKRRSDAADKLKSMGTNAWPAVLALVDLLDNKDANIGFTSGLVLAQIKAQNSPEWGVAESRCFGRWSRARVFDHLLTGIHLREDTDRRRFGLIGLAAVGPVASSSIPAVVNELKSKEEHELWRPAMLALRKIGGDVNTVVPFQKRVVIDTDESIEVRVSAAEALSAIGSEDPEVAEILRKCLVDDKALIRLAAARQLWKLKVPPAEVLPTATNLLCHKLVSVRTGALRFISEMGSAAQTIRPEVVRLTSDDNSSVRDAAVSALVSMEKSGHQ